MISDLIGVSKIMVSIIVRTALLVPAAITAFVVWDKDVIRKLLEWSWK